MSFVLSKNSVNIDELPTQVDISIDTNSQYDDKFIVGSPQAFSAPYSTLSEGFTKTAPDLLASDWYGSISVVEGKFGNGVKSNGGSIYNTSQSISASQGFVAFSCYINVEDHDASPNHSQFIFLNDSSTNSDIRLFLYGNRIGMATWESATGPKNWILSNIYHSDMEGTGFHHIFVYMYTDGSDMNMYIDGVPQNSFSHVQALNNQTPIYDQIGLLSDSFGTGILQGVTLSDVYISTDPLILGIIRDYKYEYSPNSLSFNLDATSVEHFTQTGYDVPEGEWYGDYNITESLYRNGFVGNGINAYIDLTLKKPEIGNFFGVSFVAKIQSLITSGRLFSITNSSDDNFIPFEVAYYNNLGTNYGIYAYSKVNDGGVKELLTSGIDPIIDEYFHVFAWIDMTQPVADRLELYINNVRMTNKVHLDDFSTGLSNFDNVTIGASNSLGYNFFADVEISNLYMSTEPTFKNRVSDYYNISTTSRLFFRPNYIDKELFTQDSSSNLVNNPILSTNPTTNNISAKFSRDDDSYAIIDNLPTISYTYGFSIRFKITDTTSGINKTLFEITQNGNINNYFIKVEKLTTNRIEIYMKDNLNNVKRYTTNSSVSNDVWHHLFFFNGALNGTDQAILLLDNVSNFTRGENSAFTSLYGSIVGNIARRSSLIASTDIEVSDFYISNDIGFGSYSSQFFDNTIPSIGILDYNTVEYKPTNGDVSSVNWLGDATQQDSLIGKGVLFSGNGSVNLIDKVPLDFSNKFIGVSFWFKPTTFNATHTLVFLKDTSNSNSRLFEITMDSTSISILNTIDSYTDWNNSNVQKYDFTPENKWYHCFAYIDLIGHRNGGRHAYIFIDGVEGTNTVYNNQHLGFSANPDVFLLGKKLNDSNSSVDHFSGEICDFYLSTDHNFKNRLQYYSKLPSVEIS
jgi:hypothetical protein